MKTIIMLCVVFVASTCTINAATKVSKQSGPFRWASTWTDNTPPAAGDNIIIQAGHGVHGTGGAVVNDLTVRGNLTLFHPGLTVNGNLRVENGASIAALSGTLYFKGASCTNDGTISASTLFNGAGNQSISGTGLWNANYGEFNFGTKTLADVRMMTGTWIVNTRVVVASRWLMTNGRVTKSPTGIIEGAGRVEFQGTGHFSSNETTGNLWSVPVEISTGTRSAVNSSSISAPVTIKSGTELSTHLNITLNLKDNVTIETNGKLSGQTVRLSGVNVVNDGEVFPTVLEFNRDGDQAIAGGGAWRNSNGIYFRGSGTKSLLNNMATSVGTVSVESTLNLNEHHLTVNAGNFNKPATGKIIGTGKIVSTGNGRIYSHETTGNLWLAPLEIATGTRGANSTSSFSAPITVKSGATLSTHLRVTIHAKDDVTIETNGKLSGALIQLSGVNVVNDGEVFPTVLEFKRDGDQAIAGGGAWRNSNGIYFRGSGTKSLLNNMATSVSTVSVESTLNLNEHHLTVNAGNFNKPATGKIIGTGKIISTGNGNVYSHETTGNLWLAPLEIATGTRGANSTSSFSAPITVKSGATLSTHLRVTIHAKNKLTLEAGASIKGETLELYNGDFLNNGAVAPVRTLFNGSNTLSGTTGSFGGQGAFVESGASVRLVGVQQFTGLAVRSGGAFDISNSTIRVSGVLSVAGTLTTIASTIEFNSTSVEQSVPTNIDYHNLIINNSREVNLGAAETVQNVLRLERGVFNIATNRLTIGACGQIIYVNGTLNGTPIYLACIKSAFTGDTPRIGVPLPPSINILTVQDSQPVVLNQNVTVTERLELNSDLTTGSFILTMPAEAVFHRN